ncbi:hypothetical protein JW859_04445 [bacterium]|nr:hypothetical protein [bacterium]
MKRLLTVLALILLAGCGGGGGAPIQLPDDSGTAGEVGAVTLQLSARAEDGSWRVVLSAPNATDLYQLAGTLAFDPADYTVVDCRAGGGLGAPEECYFLSGEAIAGELDFAYTRRFHGAGASGDLCLLEVLVQPAAEFRLADFSLATGTEALKVRNSQRQLLRVGFRRGVQQ